MRLKYKKTIIITGGLGLLGLALAEDIGRDSNLVLLDVKKEDELKKLKNYFEIKKNILFLKCDVSNKENLNNCRKKIKKKFKNIDVLINNAAYNDPIIKNKKVKSFENYSLKDWNKSISMNLNSLFLCSQIFGKEMIKKKKGSIINISSVYGIVSPDQKIYVKKKSSRNFIKGPAYPTAKAGMINFSRYLASYWGKKGVRVNSVSIGGIENNQDISFIRKYSSKTALGRMARTSDIVGIIKFLCTDESSYITGSNIVVDGGLTAI